LGHHDGFLPPNITNGDPDIHVHAVPPSIASFCDLPVPSILKILENEKGIRIMRCARKPSLHRRMLTSLPPSPMLGASQVVLDKQSWSRTIEIGVTDCRACSHSADPCAFTNDCTSRLHWISHTAAMRASAACAPGACGTRASGGYSCACLALMMRRRQKLRTLPEPPPGLCSRGVLERAAAGPLNWIDVEAHAQQRCPPCAWSCQIES
jgi:hypothetical protein